jgi:hypothetical protein
MSDWGSSGRRFKSCQPDVFVINMQAHYDAEIAREHLATALATIERIA